MKKPILQNTEFTQEEIEELPVKYGKPCAGQGSIDGFTICFLLDGDKVIEHITDKEGNVLTEWPE